MPRIYKKPHFFKKNYFNIFGTTWLFLGGVSGILSPDTLLGYLYMLMGAVYFVAGYIKRHNITAYIEWDEEKLIISDWYEKEVVYPLDTVDDLIFSRENLIIKSGAAKGTMMDIKGFKEEDIQLLKEEYKKIFPSASGAAVI